MLLACAACGGVARAAGLRRPQRPTPAAGSFLIRRDGANFRRVPPLRRGSACCWLVPPWLVDPGSAPIRSRNLGSRFVHLFNEGSASVHPEPIFAPGWTYAEPGMRQWPKSEPGSSPTDEIRTRDAPTAKIRTRDAPMAGKRTRDAPTAKIRTRDGIRDEWMSESRTRKQPNDRKPTPRSPLRWGSGCLAFAHPGHPARTLPSHARGIRRVPRLRASAAPSGNLAFAHLRHPAGKIGASRFGKGSVCWQRMVSAQRGQRMISTQPRKVSARLARRASAHPAMQVPVCPTRWAPVHPSRHVPVRLVRQVPARLWRPAPMRPVRWAPAHPSMQAPVHPARPYASCGN